MENIPIENAQPVLGGGGTPKQILRRKEPENLEYSFPTLSTFTTPNDQFYVRSHFRLPPIDTARWQVTVEGAVSRKMDIGIDEIKAMPAFEQMVTLECAGNGRIFLVPKANGDNWELGAVSNALWKGAMLSAVLDKAGVKPEAVEVILEGADEGEPDDTPKPPGKIHFARSIPMSKVKDVLLAYEMNGEPLPPSHGAPLRAVVGGWYGMASVKWLRRIVVSDRPFSGYFQTVDYSYWDDQSGMPIRVPITEMSVKAQIARPGLNETVPARSEYRIVGAAWTGESEVVKVEVSTDGGNRFSKANLLGEPIRHAWRFWEYFWQTPTEPGSYQLTARATDARGRSQPGEHDKRYGNYVISHTLPVEVNVK